MKKNESPYEQDMKKARRKKIIKAIIIAVIVLLVLAAAAFAAFVVGLQHSFDGMKIEITLSEEDFRKFVNDSFAALLP